MTRTRVIGKSRGGLVVLAAGGTGGHVFPALAVADALHERGYETLLFTDKRGAKMMPDISGDKITRDEMSGHTDIHVISAASPFQGNPLRRMVAVAKIGAGMMAAGISMIRRRPIAMIGFGGYPSFGPMAAAKILAVPMTLHEQNGFLGRANRALARLAGRLALSWADTANLPDNVDTKLVGMPVRPAFFTIAAAKAAQKTDIIELLIIGGSQGAAIFASLIPAAIAKMDGSLRDRMSITQQCRAEQQDEIRAAYAALGIKAEIATFFTDMPDRLAKSHLVITRSGASSVAEVAAAGRAAVMIPLPGAMDDHQTMNANQLVTAGGGIILPQGTVAADDLADNLAAEISALLATPSLVAKMGQKAQSLARPNAAAAIADYALSFIREAGQPHSCKGGTA